MLCGSKKHGWMFSRTKALFSSTSSTHLEKSAYRVTSWFRARKSPDCVVEYCTYEDKLDKGKKKKSKFSLISFYWLGFFWQGVGSGKSFGKKNGAEEREKLTRIILNLPGPSWSCVFHRLGDATFQKLHRSDKCFKICQLNGWIVQVLT